MIEGDNNEQIKDIPGLPISEEALLNDSTNLSLKEAQQLSSGKSTDQLAKEAAANEHNRTEGFRDLFDLLIKIGMVLAFGAIIAFSFTWVWHLITPPTWHWLPAEEIAHIQNLVTGGVLAALVSDHFRKRLG